MTQHTDRLNAEHRRHEDALRDLHRQLADATRTLRRQRRTVRVSSTVLTASAAAVFFGAWGFMREPLLAVGIPAAILAFIAGVVALFTPAGYPEPEEEVLRVERRIEDRTRLHNRRIDIILAEEARDAA